MHQAAWTTIFPPLQTRWGITGLQDGCDYGTPEANPDFEARASASETTWNVLTKLDGLTLIESIPKPVSAAAISG